MYTNVKAKLKLLHDRDKREVNSQPIVRTERVFNTADVSLNSEEAQRRRATLSQSPAMHSALPATVSFVQPTLFLPVAIFKMSIIHALKVNYRIFQTIRRT